MDILIDFNGVSPDGEVLTLLDLATDESRIKPGARVLVGDHDGVTCYASVASVDERGAVELVLDAGFHRAVKAANG